MSVSHPLYLSMFTVVKPSSYAEPGLKRAQKTNKNNLKVKDLSVSLKDYSDYCPERSPPLAVQSMGLIGILYSHLFNHSPISVIVTKQTSLPKKFNIWFTLKAQSLLAMLHRLTITLY